MTIWLPVVAIAAVEPLVSKKMYQPCAISDLDRVGELRK